MFNKEDANYKWAGICSALGINIGDGRHCACPICGPGKTGDRFRFADQQGKGNYYCSGCGTGDGWKLLMEVLHIDFKQAVQEVEKIIGIVKPVKHQPEEKITPEVLREIFKTSHPVRKDDAVHKYLTTRGISQIPHSLRCTSKCWEPETKKHQRAMLAVFSLPTSEAVTMHRTFIDNEGHKLDIDKPKKMLPTLKPMTGGAVRLFEHTGQIGIAEGIETALAVHEMYAIPCWAALSAPLMEGFKPPVDVKEVIVFGDRDITYTGQKSAYTLANRLHIHDKIKVSVEFPKLTCNDFLDELIAASATKGRDECQVTE
jgi:putative DNA primase/helicase